MPTRVRRVVTAIDRDGNSFSEVHTETGQGNEWKDNDPVPLDEAGPEAAKWKADYSANVIADRNKNKADKDKLTEQHATELANLQQQHSIELADLQTQLNALRSELDLSIATVNALTIERDQLAAELEAIKNPPTTPYHQFLRLLTPEEIEVLIRSTVSAERADAILQELS